jgi:EAL domain-containing protein (putative c-di-GMP-specific phosphodiesterase class I)
LKIDRSFVVRTKDSEKDVAIVNAIITMGHAMNMRLVAEGVETREQCDLLRDMNCDEMQGFLFSPPVSAKNATAMMLRQDEEKRHGLMRDMGLAS